VYLEEVFLSPPPTFLTAVPIFIGIAAPQNAANRENNREIAKPVLLRLWTEFIAAFWQVSKENYLYSTVQGFFLNGGTQCYAVVLQSEDALSDGLKQAEDVADIDLVCAPGLSTERVYQQILEHCAALGDRFAILDSPNESPDNDDSLDLYGSYGSLGSYGAMYGPWIQVEPAASLSKPRYVPPCGHVAGVYARSDREFGFHRAPANLVVEGVLGLGSQNFKHPRINQIQSVQGRGIRVWGARTLSTEDNWKFINVRRVFITVQRWIEATLADVTFEPNDYKLWLRIEREVRTYLESLFRQGAFRGKTIEEAFYVKCDEETNSPELRQQGQVLTEIGLAPTVPGQFIVVRLIHDSTGVSLMPLKFSPSANTPPTS
jgi:phage tail sheath protein FI